ncbi:MAG: hypothetical protein A3A10_01635 [Candidatus Tagabacteria bacterium RIFCSPLOWO2_01_FULL_42_9]|uniref:Transcription elongation factor GreA n=1 Tax=Candidatus Tagabacteria bacterium RIFCSPLOWO2_01_FULL_42_9 TaxID=1802296 RepID=A0A1G2LTK1_9BACT|nr:MAG: hypothetical protein A3A10_01635 [Candidatus Tagabacteria bacterium RIFCSPLOWO2_01_FULL_42_9]
MLESPKFQNEELREEPEYLTREGFERLQKELEELKNRRLEIAKLLEEAIDDGDLTENAAFHGAKERQEENEMQIAELEDKLRRAAIIEKEKTGVGQLGSTLVLKKEGNAEELAYFLVGAAEADPLKGKISNESPLGSALMGRKKGESVEVLTPGGKIKYTITDVN